MAPCILLVHPRFSRFFSIWQHPHLLLAKSQCFMVYLTFPGLDPLSVDGFSSFSASIWASTCLCLMWESQRAFEGREPLPNCQTKRSIYIHIYIYYDILEPMVWLGVDLSQHHSSVFFCFFCGGPHSQRVARHEDCPLKSWCTGRTSASPGPWTKLTLDIREMPPKSWGTSWLV